MANDSQLPNPDQRGKQATRFGFVPFGILLLLSALFITLLYLVQERIWSVMGREYVLIAVGAVLFSGAAAFFLTFRQTKDENRSQQPALQALGRLIAGSLVAALVTDGEGKILQANEIAADIFGYGSQELAGLPAAYLVPEYARVLAAHSQANLLLQPPGKAGKVMMVIGQHKDGSAIPLEIRMRQAGALDNLRDAQSLWVSYLVDISPYKGSAERPTHSLGALKAGMEACSEGILVTDEQYRPIFYNRAYLSIWGQAENEIWEAGLAEVHLHQANQVVDPPAFLRRIGELPQESTAIIDLIEMKDGRRIERRTLPQWSDGTAAGGLWLYRDVTDKYKTELALRQAETDTRHASGELARMVYELENRAQETILLNEMGDLMQLCTNRDEAYQIVSRYVQQLFPETQLAGGGGILGVLMRKSTPLSGTETARVQSTNTQPIRAHVVRVVQSWGSFIGKDEIFSSALCWALRRNRIHTEDGSQATNLCQHVGLDLPVNYICVPLISQGEALGILTLVAGSEESQPDPGVWANRSRQNLIVTFGERVSLALANLNLRESLREQAIQDSLTGLFNRRYLEMAIEREIRRMRRQKVPLSVIMVDIDHFKNFNDAFGHQAGDYVLREVANVLIHAVRLEDIVSRYGGEEFLMILPGSAGKDAARRAEQIRQHVEKLKLEFEGMLLGRITLSVGVVELDDEFATPDDLVRAADEAMYLAKSSGRNRVYYKEGV